MSIKIRYFASLKERLGRSEDELEGAGGLTIEQIWRRVNDDKPMPSNVLAAVNMDYVDNGTIVRDGDEVAFFPPVTGG
ncbi:MAG: MoaD/ThiS family protein [Gammaproteobacteria bacterium]